MILARSVLRGSSIKPCLVRCHVLPGVGLCRSKSDFSRSPRDSPRTQGTRDESNGESSEYNRGYSPRSNQGYSRSKHEGSRSGRNDYSKSSAEDGEDNGGRPSYRNRYSNLEQQIRTAGRTSSKDAVS